MKVRIRGFHDGGDQLVTVEQGKNSLSLMAAEYDAECVLDFLDRVVPEITVRKLEEMLAKRNRERRG